MTPFIAKQLANKSKYFRHDDVLYRILDATENAIITVAMENGGEKVIFEFGDITEDDGFYNLKQTHLEDDEDD